MRIVKPGCLSKVGERMSAPLAEGADENGVNRLSNPPMTLTSRDLSLLRGNLNTIRRWAVGGTTDTQQVLVFYIITFQKSIVRP